MSHRLHRPLRRSIVRPILFLFAALVVALSTPSTALARERISGWCQQGAQPVVAPASVATSPVTRSFQQTYPACTVTVYLSGTANRANIYSDNNSTALANPFGASTSGFYFFYVDTGRYDIQVAGGGLPAPVTFSDVMAYDPAPVIDVRTCLPGSTDLGAKLNACFPQVVNGGEIDIYPPYAGSSPATWAWNTPAVLTAATFVRLHCVGNKGGPVVLLDGITGAGAASMLTITGTTANSADILIDNCRFQGNNQTGAPGNGHGITIISNPVGGFSPIRVTLREDSFWYFQGTGVDYSGAQVGAAGVYGANAHVLLSDNTDYVSNQYGVLLDSGFKITFRGGDFDSNAHNGVMLRAYSSLGPAENLEFTDQAIFNANGSGGATDGGLYATNFYHLTVAHCRAKANNPYDLKTGPDENVEVTYDDNHIYRGQVSGIKPSISISPSTVTANITANSFFFDFESSSPVGVKLEPAAGGFNQKSARITGNRMITSLESGVALDKGVWVGQGVKSFFVDSNSVGSDTPGGGEIINSAFYIEGTDGQVTNNSCANGAARTFTDCVTLTSSSARNVLWNNTTFGTVTNALNANSAATYITWDGTNFRTVGGNINVPFGNTISIGTQSPVGAFQFSYPGSNQYVLDDTTQPANQRKWRILNPGGTFQIGTLSDDGQSGTAGLVITRSGTSAGLIGIGTTGPINSGTGKYEFAGDTAYVFNAQRTPGTSGATCNVGEMAFDGSYVYVCVATNTWKRAALSTW